MKARTRNLLRKYGRQAGYAWQRLMVREDADPDNIGKDEEELDEAIAMINKQGAYVSLSGIVENNGHPQGELVEKFDEIHCPGMMLDPPIIVIVETSLVREWEKDELDNQSISITKNPISVSIRFGLEGGEDGTMLSAPGELPQ